MSRPTKVILNCAICNKEIQRSPSHIISKNAFCSRKHKEKGMILGLVAPMRLGTGYGVKDILTRRKYYKYRQFDRKHNFKEMSKTVREFVKHINESLCYYCGSKDSLGYDRKNNSKGHSKNNIVVSCEICNMTRGNRFSVNEMVLIRNIIKQIKEGRDGIKQNI